MPRDIAIKQIDKLKWNPNVKEKNLKGHFVQPPVTCQQFLLCLLKWHQLLPEPPVNALRPRDNYI